MPPIVSIIGKSSTGKTTFLEKLIREINSRGYKLATIKHSHHTISFDQPNKDSWRHAQAGACATMVSSASEIQIIKPVKQEPTLDQLACQLGEEYDLILTEGFSHASAPKIEMHRKEAGPLLENVFNHLAIVTDEPLETEVKQFTPDDVKGVADLLEGIYLKTNQDHISLYVNGESIPLSVFPRQIIKNILLAITDSLKGIKDVDNLEYRYRKGK